MSFTPSGEPFPDPDEDHPSLSQPGPENRRLLGDLEPLAREHRPVLFAAVIGLLVGVFLWGSVLMAVASGIGDFVGGDSNEPAATDEPVASEVDAIDCDAFGSQRALSDEQEAVYQEQCADPTPAPDAEESPPADPTRNRQNCAEIRGTDYLSPEERTWFLDNCVNVTP